ncbi:MAG: tRNA lysidine(34) synthetase TilS [Candidatus Bipolaricaulota bacterium]|nr:tRNA lysidine(34) synthetase TilS [Candidatus Bipolaricaulota bacterium]MDW8126441.1 tRNA lysidine(34) synthetase TilS [Candidatus Bipolaricaulota bacterium]
MAEMLEKVRTALTRYKMVGAGERVLVAVSGGADSMALLYSLWWLRKDFGITLAMAHLDHGIRRDTAEDLKVVQKAAEDLGLPLLYDRVDAPSFAKREKLNLEEAARRLRRDFLLRAAEQAQAQKIALGHTRTDLAETVLLHLLRGAGPSGLKGFLPVSPPFIRPLILCAREETQTFCKTYSIPFHDDPTNFDTRYLRNAIRLKLLPQLRDYNPRVEEALAKAAVLLAETEEVLEWAKNRACSELWRGRGLDLLGLRALPKPLQALLVRALASQHGVRLYHRHVEAILRGIERAQAAEYHLPNGLVAHIGGGLLAIEKAAPLPQGVWQLCLPGETSIPELGWDFRLAKIARPAQLDSHDPYLVYVSAKKLQPPLFVRRAAATDVFRPFGEGREKRVRDVLARQGIPRWERERWPVVVDGRGVVWVVGVRLSGEYSVEEDEKEVIFIQARRI